ncbi:DOMON-like domain-containing protein [Novosphingobium sp.]|uniref:DOMON-like domain-containing protein n=1 Tax=Novosphingobium sp. TaxID=1874826 RepID=UPI0025E2DD53|nr:DOMON-like domain-containing protein [Novosphingobium sp.]
MAVRWGRVRGGEMMLRFRLDGCEALVLPGARLEGRADGLWQTTCCELFLALEGGCYREFNFAPSGQWAAYDFRGYRTGMAEYEPVSAPRIDVDRGLSVSTFTVFLPESEFAGARFAGLSAVIEEQGGRLSYWAARHGGEKPDFHNPACFMLPVP